MSDTRQGALPMEVASSDPFRQETSLEPTQALEVVSATALESISRAEIDIQIRTAKQYPRPSMSVIQKRILGLATLDREVAKSCYYSLKRSGKAVEGPSIRLAEIAFSQYGNMRVASRIVGNDGRKITAQAACHDLEVNNATSIEVDRRITDREGNTYNDDMQITTANAAQSIARRNAILQVIPRALIGPVWQQCKMVAMGEKRDIGTIRKELLGWAEKSRIKPEQIVAHFDDCDGYQPIGSVEDLSLEHLMYLQGVATAIAEKQTSISEQFPAVISKPLFKKPKVQPPAEGEQSA